MSTQTKFSEKDIVKTNPIFSRTRTTIESAFYANNMTHIADTATAYRLAADNPNTIVTDLPIKHTEELGLQPMPRCWSTTMVRSWAGPRQHGV